MTFAQLMRETLSAKTYRKLQTLLPCVICRLCRRRCHGRRAVPVGIEGYALPRGRCWRTYRYSCPCGTLHEFQFSGYKWLCSMTRDFAVRDLPWKSTYDVESNRTLFAPVDDHGVPKQDAIQALPGFVTPERFSKLLPFT